MESLKHETLFRGDLKKLKDYTIWVGGCGALGSNIAEGLARHGVQSFILVDYDRIEASNLGTQPWYSEEIGSMKAATLSKRLYRINKAKTAVITQRFDGTAFNKFLPDKVLPNNKYVLVDAFDNFETRKLVKDFRQGFGGDCVHSGMSGDGYGEVVWDEKYVIPSKKSQGVDVCEYPLARNLVIFVSTLCTEAIIDWILTGKKYNYRFTLTDKSIVKEVITVK